MKVICGGSIWLLVAWLILLMIPPLGIAAFAGAIAGLVVAYGRMFVESRFMRVR